MVSSSGMDGENLDGDQEALEQADTPHFQISHAWYYGPSQPP